MPILIIFICNSLIIIRTIQAEIQRKKLKLTQQPPKKPAKDSNPPLFRSEKANGNKQKKTTTTVTLNSLNDSNKVPFNSTVSNQIVSYRVKPYYVNHATSSKKMTNQTKNLNKITRTLMLISLTYAILNLPYFITWSIYFYETTFQEEINLETSNYLFSALQISELFYVL